MTKKNLLPHEWLAIVAVSAMMLMFGVIAYWNAPGEMDFPELVEEITVYVEGAIEHSGSFLIKKGHKLEDLLALVKPLPEADLSKIKPKSKLREGQQIKIPSKYITIYLEGAVEGQKEWKVLRGTKFEEIENQVTFAKNANLKKIGRKHKLRDQEILYIPFRRG